MVLLVILYLVHNMFMSAPVLTDYAPTSLILGEDYTDYSRAIFLISMGTQAQQSKIVERFVWSARHRGQWKGWIVLLTDAPKSRYADLTHHWIVMHPQPQHFNTSFAEDMPYKRFKTYVLDYIDMDQRLNSVGLIYYLDVDIVVGNSLLHMMYELEQTHGIPNSVRRTIREDYPISRIWFFKGNYKHLMVQGGQMILDRYSSKPCLGRWRELIDQHPERPKDQPYLQQMRQHPTEQCEIRIMSKAGYLHFPSNSSMITWAREIQKNSWSRKRKYRSFPPLVHIKNSGKVAKISDHIEEIYLKDLLQVPNDDIHQDTLFLDIGKKMHFLPDASNVTTKR
jgi:hypothetical protein